MVAFCLMYRRLSSFVLERLGDIKFDSRRLKLILRGIKKCSPPSKLVSVLSHKQLVSVVRVSKKVLGKMKGRSFADMITCAFFGFLRPSEYSITRAGHEVLVRDILL